MKKRGNNSRQLKVSVPGTYIFTILVSLSCWIIGYIFSVGFPLYEDTNATPIWHSICHILPDKSSAYTIGLLLTLLGALLIQRTNYVLILIREKTFLPFALFLLLISTNPDFFPLKSTSAGIFCLILAMYQLFKSYHDPGARLSAFNAAFLVGIGSLLWIHILWFLPLFWYGMYSFKTLNIKTFLASLLGMATVYWFVFAWCLIYKDFTLITVPFTTLAGFRLLMISGQEWYDWVGIIYIAILTVTASLYIITHEYEDSLRTRQYLWFIILFACVAFCLFLIYEQSSEEFLSVACMPASILLAHFFTVKRGNFYFWLYQVSVCILCISLIARLWRFLSVMAI